MNAKDLAGLAGLFAGANITINVQTGSGTMYTGPVQINNHVTGSAAEPCSICGRPVIGRGNHHFGGGAEHWECVHQLDQQRRMLRPRIELLPEPMPEEVEDEPEAIDTEYAEMIKIYGRM